MKSARVSRAHAVIVLVVVAASSRIATAADEPAPSEPPPPRLEVVAPTGCATSQDLEARVIQRSPRIRFSPDAAAGFTLRVEVVTEPNGAVAATLDVAGRDRSHDVRHLAAGTCAEALDALALMIAVLLDPRALVGPPARSAPAAMVTEPEPPPPPRRWGVALGAAAHTVAGPMPAAAPGFAAGVAVAPEPGTGHRYWSPAARLSWAHDWLADWRAPGGTAAFTLDSLELDVCPVALGTAGFAARACAAAIGSRVAATGSHTFMRRSQADYLMAAGASLWLTLRVAPHVALEASAAAAPSLRRDSFAFDPNVFYRVASMTFTGSLGLGVTFP